MQSLRIALTVDALLAEAADPFVRYADISPSRGISFPKGSLYKEPI